MYKINRNTYMYVTPICNFFRKINVYHIHKRLFFSNKQRSFGKLKSNMEQRGTCYRTSSMHRFLYCSANFVYLLMMHATDILKHMQINNDIFNIVIDVNNILKFKCYFILIYFFAIFYNLGINVFQVGKLLYFQYSDVN